MEADFWGKINWHGRTERFVMITDPENVKSIYNSDRLAYKEPMESEKDSGILIFDLCGAYLCQHFIKEGKETKNWLDCTGPEHFFKDPEHFIKKNDTYLGISIFMSEFKLVNLHSIKKFKVMPAEVYNDETYSGLYYIQNRKIKIPETGQFLEDLKEFSSGKGEHLNTFEIWKEKPSLRLENFLKNN